MKKGRHRRFEEARALKRNTETLDDDAADILFDPPRSSEPCPECNAAPGKEHASWCLHDDDEVEEDKGWD